MDAAPYAELRTQPSESDRQGAVRRGSRNLERLHMSGSRCPELLEKLVASFGPRDHVTGAAKTYAFGADRVRGDITDSLL